MPHSAVTYHIADNSKSVRAKLKMGAHTLDYRCTGLLIQHCDIYSGSLKVGRFASEFLAHFVRGRRSSNFKSFTLPTLIVNSVFQVTTVQN